MCPGDSTNHPDRPDPPSRGARIGEEGTLWSFSRARSLARSQGRNATSRTSVSRPLRQTQVEYPTSLVADRPYGRWPTHSGQARTRPGRITETEAPPHVLWHRLRLSLLSLQLTLAPDAAEWSASATQRNPGCAASPSSFGEIPIRHNRGARRDFSLHGRGSTTVRYFWQGRAERGGPRGGDSSRWLDEEPVESTSAAS